MSNWSGISNVASQTTYGTITAISIQPSIISITADDIATYTAIATDAKGNTWTVTSETSFSAERGTFSNNIYHPKEAGTWTITGTHISGLSATATVVVTEGSPAIITLSAIPSTITADQGTTIFAYVEDKNNNPISGAIIYWATTGGIITATSTTQDGTATAIFSSTKTGTYIITGSVTDGVSGTTSVIVRTGSPNKLTITSPKTTTTNATFTLTITLCDENENPVAGTQSVSLNNTTNSISPTSIQLTNGTWTGSATIKTSPNGGEDTITARYETIEDIATITVYINTQQGTVTFGGTHSAMVDFGPGTLGTANVTVSLSTSTTLPVNLPSGIQFAGIVYNIFLFDDKGNPFGTQSLPRSVTLYLPYQDKDNNGIVDGTNINEKDLIIYQLENNQWRALTTQINEKENIASAYVSHFSTFTVGAKLPPTFAQTNENAFAYPNPWHPKFGDYIYFAQVSQGSVIKIYDIAGTLIDEIPVTEHPQRWNIRGKNIASGIYIYVIKDSKQTKIGKLAIIQ